MKLRIGLALTASLLLASQADAATVQSKSGVKVRVNPSARAALQCIVDYVEGAGVKVKYMRGYGPGTVRHSLHPSGNALDINQTARNRTRPAVPRSVSNAAADHCGVVSGARWHYADNGHWNLTQVGHSYQGFVPKGSLALGTDVAARAPYPF